jgi:hypothetical protein
MSHPKHHAGGWHVKAVAQPSAPRNRSPALGLGTLEPDAGVVACTGRGDGNASACSALGRDNRSIAAPLSGSTGRMPHGLPQPVRGVAETGLSYMPSHETPGAAHTSTSGDRELQGD